jgi:hypothetical protein
MNWKRSAKWIIVFGLAVLIKALSFFPNTVEKYYSQGFYPIFSRLLRILLGWVPFSMGDIFYTCIFIWLLVKIFSFFKKLFTGRIHKPYFLYLCKRLVWICLMIYIVFNLAWGLNYNRQGISYQLQLEVQPYSTLELDTLVKLVVNRLNELADSSRIDRGRLKNKKILFIDAFRSYQNLTDKSNQFSYRSHSIKPSIFSYFGNYLGFTGYYNPFSGEAQVNTTVPVFIQPFTTCHEMGHQLGYAKENEANFAGYLSAKSSNDPVFRYSAYFDLYIYAASELYARDSTMLKPLREQLKPAVREDYKTLRLFLDQYKNPLEPYIRRLYGRYLKANNQPQGIQTYNEVTAWMIAYYKKYGKEAL